MVTLFPPKIIIPPTLPKTAFSGIQTTLSNLWKNTGVKLGVGLASVAGGVWALGGATQEATKPLGEFGGISGSVIFIVIIAVVLLLVLKK